MWFKTSLFCGYFEKSLQWMSMGTNVVCLSMFIKRSFFLVLQKNKSYRLKTWLYKCLLYYNKKHTSIHGPTHEVMKEMKSFKGTKWFIFCAPQNFDIFHSNVNTKQKATNPNVLNDGYTGYLVIWSPLRPWEGHLTLGCSVFTAHTINYIDGTHY